MLAPWNDGSAQNTHLNGQPREVTMKNCLLDSTKRVKGENASFML